MRLRNSPRIEKRIIYLLYNAYAYYSLFIKIKRIQFPKLT